MNWNRAGPYNIQPNGQYSAPNYDAQAVGHPPSSYSQYDTGQQQHVPFPNHQYAYPYQQMHVTNVPMVVPQQHSQEYPAQFQYYPSQDVQPVLNNYHQAPPHQQQYVLPQHNIQHPSHYVQPQRHARPQQPSQQISHVQPSPVPQARPQAVDPPAEQQPPFPIDFEVLLCLAEEYVTAARSAAPTIALNGSEADVEHYGKLMATGMACLETVLKRYKLRPRAEAVVRLRYATLIHEETTNDQDAQTVLSKGIMLCETNRLVNLKYSMLHLSARVAFKTAPRAALRSLDKAIADAETMRKEAWVYALRFLRATLSMRTGSHHDALSALQQLRSISALAESCRDVGIFITCAAFETMTHLMISGPDSIEQAQRAIASARTYQLELSGKDMPQIWTMLDFFDIVCGMESSQWAETIMPKIAALQGFLRQQNPDDAPSPWNDDGSFGVVFDRADPSLAEDSNGIFRETSSGQTALAMSWLPLRDNKLLAYYLIGMIRMEIPARAQMPREMLREKAKADINLSLSLAERFLQVPKVARSALPAATARKTWHRLAQWRIKLCLVFLHCQSSDWLSAKQCIDQLEEMAEVSGMTDEFEGFRPWNIYVQGVYAQSIGDFDTAIKTYQAPELALPEVVSLKANDAIHDLQILAALNTVLIVSASWHPQHKYLPQLVAKLGPHCSGHNNPSIYSMYNLVCSLQLRDALRNPTEETRDAVIYKHRKQLSKTLNELKKRARNDQVFALAFCYFRDIVFDGVRVSNAVNASKSARVSTRRFASEMWTAAADSMYADTLRRRGEFDDANCYVADCHKYLTAEPFGPGSGMPARLREACMVVDDAEEASAPEEAPAADGALAADA